MMRSLYATPLRVYLLIGLLALIGIYAGTKLPISLFPNSAQPAISVTATYGPMTGDEYRSTYGNELESMLRRIKSDDVHVEKMDADYRESYLNIDVIFRWGDGPDAARREVDSVIARMTSRIGNSRDFHIDARSNNRNSGFLAISFFSKDRSPDELYRVIDPILNSRIKQVQDAEWASVSNPQSKEVRIDLKPEALTSLQVTVQTVELAIRSAFTTKQGGDIISSGKSLSVIVPRQINTVEDLGMIAITTPTRKIVPLRDIATITLGPDSNSENIYKTSGAASVILFASPKAGGNVKAMSEDILREVDEAMKEFPQDIQYRTLVDPSEFIRSSINNVFHEVFIGSILAVMVLLLFIGSPRNVATAAIEIPISLVLAFILMRIAGMNINLISLGGLALSAGMNVDASVVVMENIFRHFERHHGRLTASEKLDVVMGAVAEVRGPVIASTLASLVVFIPLAFTSNLSYAILGDLAKAVVFSHAFSAAVALILVPTVRLHLMSREAEVQHPRSPIEGALTRLEMTYSSLLQNFMTSGKAKISAIVGLACVLAGLMVFALPRLPKEIIGTPDTDWIFIGVRSEGNTKTKQMEMVLDQVERDVMAKFAHKISYTFYQLWGADGGGLMVRLRDKSEMNKIVKQFEETLQNTATTKISTNPWNPSELPLPNPPQLQIAITGSTATQRSKVAIELSDLLESNHTFPRIFTVPDATQSDIIEVKPRTDQWLLANAGGIHVTMDDIFEQMRTQSSGRKLENYPFGEKSYSVSIGIAAEPAHSIDDIGSWSVPFGGKIVPLRALADIKKTSRQSHLRLVNGREVNFVYGNLPKLSRGEAPARRIQAKDLVNNWRKDYEGRNPKADSRTTVEFEDSEQEITEAITQLSVAIGWSIVLIFLTMVLQFGSIIEPLIVLAAIPLGFIGALASLFVFQSSLSLNSALGVIMLNGIAVANSIILVDFTKKLVAEGLTPIAAATRAARARLRPILITSLTTVLGMLPIACGLGDGGKVLQPLGISVAGGLWVSMLLTLFAVPALHVSYLNASQRPSKN